MTDVTRQSTYRLYLAAAAVAGTLLIALDGLHYWHDVRFLFATTQFPFPEVLAGAFNPQQSWSEVDELASGGFYSAKILHLWLLGTRLLVIAECVELAPTAVRKRWQEIRYELHERLAPDLERG